MKFTAPFTFSLALLTLLPTQGEEVAMTAEKATVITFDSRTQRRYKLLAAAEASGSWATVQDGIVGTGGKVTIFYKSESDQRLFFKVETSDGPAGQRSLLSLANLDISNRDLSGYQLEGHDLRGYNFHGSTFNGANLSAANLSDARLSWGSFLGTDLSHAVLEGVDFTQGKFSGANLEGVKFVGCFASGADFRNARLNGIQFDGTVLTRANFSGANLANVSFRSSGSKWKGAKGEGLLGVNFTGANLTGADLSRNDAQGITLAGATIAGANFEGTTLVGVDMRGQDLRTVLLRGAQVGRGNWAGANAAGANMLLMTAVPGWNASGVTFEGANLEGFSAGSPDFRWTIEGADFRNTNLKGAYLEGMLFRNCDFTGADLSFANVIAADFTGCIGLDAEQPGMKFGGWPQNPPQVRPTATILPDGSPRVGTNPGTGLAPAVPVKLRLMTSDEGNEDTVNLEFSGTSYSQNGTPKGSFTYSASGNVAVLRLTLDGDEWPSVWKLVFSSTSGGDLYKSDFPVSFKVGTFTVPE